MFPDRTAETRYSGLFHPLLLTLLVLVRMAPNPLPSILASRIRQAFAPSSLVRLLIYAGLWWVLTEGDIVAWFWGVPAILAAALLNPFPTPLWRLNPFGVMRFVPIFIGYSLRSAVDVGGRAIHPGRPLRPALIDYPWRLPSVSSRVFFANLINLMPGTLCVREAERAVTVHILGGTTGTHTRLARLEYHVATLFGEKLDDDE